MYHLNVVTDNYSYIKLPVNDGYLRDTAFLSASHSYYVGFINSLKNIENSFAD